MLADCNMLTSSDLLSLDINPRTARQGANHCFLRLNMTHITAWHGFRSHRTLCVGYVAMKSCLWTGVDLILAAFFR